MVFRLLRKGFWFGRDCRAGSRFLLQGFSHRSADERWPITETLTYRGTTGIEITLSPISWLSRRRSPSRSRTSTRRYRNCRSGPSSVSSILRGGSPTYRTICRGNFRRRRSSFSQQIPVVDDPGFSTAALWGRPPGHFGGAPSALLGAPFLIHPVGRAIDRSETKSTLA